MNVILTVNDCKKLAGIDARAINADSAIYCKQNNYIYYIAVNTWLNMIKDECADMSVSPIILDLKAHGLSYVVQESLLIADSLLDSVGEGRGSIDQNTPMMCIVDYIDNRHDLTTPTGIKKTLQLLLFLKRFTPNGNDVLENECMHSFLQHNNRAKMLNRRPVKNFFVPMIKEVITDVVKGFPGEYKRQLKDCPYSLPNGSVADTSFTEGVFVRKNGDIPMCEKLLYLESEFATPILPNLPSKDYRASYLRNNPLLSNQGAWLYDVEDIKYSKQKGYLEDIPSVWCSVPKNLTHRRGIAMEFVRTTYLADPVSRALRACLEKKRKSGLSPNGTIDLSKQDNNREAALSGSIDNMLSTIDLKAASDSVYWRLVHDLFPKEVFKVLDAHRSTSTYLPTGKRVTLHLFSTMGSRLTFPLETIIFYAVAKAVCVHLKADGPVLAYGDDIIVPTIAVQTVMDVLEQLGFDVNHEKTCCSNNNFRESCGVVAFNGEDISTFFFPRRHFSADKEGNNLLSILTSLQHKMVQFDRANSFLIESILEVCPKMTYSHIGTPCDDLWSSYPVPVPGRSLYVSNKLEHLESHLTGITTFPGKKGKLPSQVDAAQRLAYYMWLKYGPHYDTPLDELLKISSLQCSYESFLSNGSTVYRRRDR